MLTIRENFMETIKGGKPDRFVKQYEYQEWLDDPLFPIYFGVLVPGTEFYNGWGVKHMFPIGEPGPFPITDEENKVCKDVTEWQKYVKGPNMVLPASDWAECVAKANKINRDEKFVTAKVFCGIFEKLHYLMGMEDTMMNFILEPEAMHDLIDYLADWEISVAEETIKYTHPDCLFHHDDWGSHRKLFMSKEMFDEFIVPAYKKIYGYWKDNGVEIIVHHSDSYAADLVSEMIDMGIDVWQGVVQPNNIPELIKEYGGQITFQGGLDNGIYDKEGWTEEEVRAGLGKLLEECGPKYLIPAMTMGGPETTFPGLYEKVDELIGEFDKVYFK